MRLIEFLKLIRSLVQIPSLEDEASLRKFLQRAVEAFAILAGYTPTPADNLAVAALRAIVTNDEVWAAFYRLIKFAAGIDDLTLVHNATGLDEKIILEMRDAIFDANHSDSGALS